MFTGIVEELGIVKRISRSGNFVLLEIAALKAAKSIKVGDSVSVNGVCLTAVKAGNNLVSFEVMAETFKITNLGGLRVNEKVNLENSLKMGDKVSGHFVLGHVDCLGIIRKKGIVSGNMVFEIAMPQEFSKYLLPKGSVAVDGISLTIQERKMSSFSVYIIPHTLKNTTLDFKGPSSKVNLEFDLLAKKESVS
jgi:riboflavin synthase